MKIASRLFGMLASLAVIASPSFSQPTPPPSAASPGAATQAKINEAYGKLPLSFEKNQGQSSGRVKFLSQGNGYSLFLTPTEAVLHLARPSKQQNVGRVKPHSGEPNMGAKEEADRDEDAVVRMRLVGSNPRPRITGLEKQPGKSNYLVGSDPKKWHTNIDNYARVKYENIYPGIDLVYYGNQRQLEYDFIVAPGIDPKRIRLGYRGVDKLTVDAQGDLILNTAAGDIKQHKPVIYQEIGGVKHIIDGDYVVNKNHQVGLQIVAYDSSRPLIIDPVLSYSTYMNLGGQQGVAVDAAGNAYVTGGTGTGAAFVAKLNSTGNALVYSMTLGGGGYSVGYDVAVDAAGSAYIGGFTNSTNFPTVNPFQRFNGGAMDGFIAKLSPAGDALVYSTYLGGNSADYLFALAIDAAGAAYVTGETSSLNFPTFSAVYPYFRNGITDIFVTKLSPSGNTLIYSSYLGSNAGGGESGTDIAVDASGAAYITGYTYASDTSNFPLVNPFQASGGSSGISSGGTDAFVTKFHPDGNSLIYSTYLGGAGTEFGQGIAVDATGSAYVTGWTSSTNFPVANALQRTYGGGGGDAFITKFNPAGNTLAYSTYLGGTGEDWGRDIAVDSSGAAYVAGKTASTNFPIANPIQSVFGGGLTDAFITKLNPAGNTLVYSTFLGGNGYDSDSSSAIAIDGNGGTYIIGDTGSTNFPLVSPYLSTPSGNFIAKIGDALPPGVLQFSSGNYSILEGAGVATITVTRTGDSTGSVSVNYATSNGTALALSDYTPAIGTLTFAAGETSKVFTVPVTNDSAVEPDETLNLTLGNVTGNATLGTPGAATLTIVNDDAALQFSAAAYSANEADGTATITVTRMGTASGTVSVNYATADGTAQAGADYTASSGTLSFGSGVTSQNFSVPIINDNILEPDEALTISLSNSTGSATLGTPGSAVLTIVNDDSALQFSASSYNVNEPDGTATITVTRLGSSTGSVSVNYASSNGSATAGSDYTAVSGTLTITDGVTHQSFAIPIINDAVVESDETVNLGLTALIGSASLGTPGSAVLTIVSEDITPQQQANNIIGQVSSLVSSGVLNQGQGNSLIVKLQAAINKLNQGNVNTAINQLRAFINEVNAKIISGALTPTQGQPLIDAANSMIQQLGG